MPATKDYYELLGIARNASTEEIGKAFKKQALRWHPDRNPTNREEAEEMFKQLNKAKQVLTDERKRRIYDQVGEVEDGDGASGNEFPAGFPADIFSMFGMGGMGMSQESTASNGGVRMSQAPPKEVQIKVSLEDLYSGKTIHQPITQIIRCETCVGVGTKDSANILTCELCSGSGRIVKMMRMGPMIQQKVEQCYKCQGAGKSIREGCSCSGCGGRKYTERRRVVDFYVKAGSQQYDKYILKGDGDWNPAFSESGNLVFVIVESQTPHSLTREGANLIYKKSLSLADALCGSVFMVKQLDERMLKIDTSGLILKSGDVVKVAGEGMPLKTDQYKRGELIIRITVDFPEKLSDERKTYLRKILPKTQVQIWDANPADYPDSEQPLVEHVRDMEYQQQRFEEVRQEDSAFADEMKEVQCAQQ
jgi:DnaJ-class molecular chaperone